MRKTPILFFVILASLVASAQDKHKDALIRQLDQHTAATLVKNDTVALKHYLASDFLLNTSGNRIHLVLNASCLLSERGEIVM